MIVKQMKSPNGKPVHNQFTGEIDGVRFFQSYQAVIAKVENGKVILDSYYWDYSPTTSKYRNIFLGETTKETRKKIESGEYTLENLN